ncbi:MAG: OmpA family protein [Pseudomonadota bacterium]
MSQGVIKLKQLLFDSENQTLSELQSRLDHLGSTSREERDRLTKHIADVASREAGYRLELTQRLDDVFAQAGTMERFKTSVANVLDSALRDAEVARHGELSEAIAPLVTKTIKVEIRNSQDDLVEALYPMTGRMVQAYVASAIKDMMDEINRRLGENPAMLRLRSITTGRSVAELALAESQKLHVEEMYLIRRGTGEILDRWPASPSKSNVDHLVSGVLTAVNDVATEAFNVKGNALRRLEVDDDAVYLRTSPSYLLVAKCKGVAHDSVEKIIDEEFLLALQHRLDTADGAKITDARPSSESPIASADASLSKDADQDLEHDGGLGTMAERMQNRIVERQEQLRTSGFNPAKLLLWILGLGLAIWLAWFAYEQYQTERVRGIAAGVIEQTADLRGYPIELDVAAYGDSISVRGLTPSSATKAGLINALNGALPQVRVQDETTVVASADAKIRPEVDRLRREVTGLSENVPSEVSRLRNELASLRLSVARETISRAFTRTTGRLSTIGTDLEQLTAELQTEAQKTASRDVSKTLSETTKALSQTTVTDTTPLSDINDTIKNATAQIESATAKLTQVIAPRLRSAQTPSTAQLATALGRSPPSGGEAASVAERAEIMALKGEQIATLIVAIKQAIALNPTAELSEREKLVAFADANAIFFSTGTEYRNRQQAEKTMRELIAISRGGELLIRVVGYTDEIGNRDDNVVLGQQRAEAVLADLLRLGMPSERLVAIGRADGKNLAPNTGENSPNRRVQFEVGYAGERAR